jgi:hypothetical protein
MSGTFDTSIVRSEELQSVWLTYPQRSLSQQRYAVRQTGHRWEITIGTKPMERADWQKLMAFHGQQRGQYNTFSYTSVAMATPLGGLAGSTYAVTVSGTSHAAGGTTVAFTGLPTSAVVLKAGDLLKFANHAKVYAVESTSVTSSTAGAATVTLHPELVSSVASGEALTYQNVPFTMSFTEDAPKWPVDVAGLLETQLTLAEVF